MKKVLLSGLAMMTAVAVNAQVDVVKLADSIKVQGIKKMELTPINGVNYAAVDVEFLNTGSQGIKFCDGTVEVMFDTKRGWVDGKAMKDAKLKAVGSVSEGKGDVKAMEATLTPQVKPQKSKALMLGNISLGSKIVPEEAASELDLTTNPIEIKGTEADGKPVVTKQTLYVKLDNAGTVTDIVNLIGNPSIPIVMRLTINSHTALLLKGGGELDDGNTRKITLNMVPSVPTDYLFK